MDIQHLKLTEVKAASNDSSAWTCDINTGMCGPVATEKSAIEPIKIDFLTNTTESEESK